MPLFTWTAIFSLSKGYQGTKIRTLSQGSYTCSDPIWSRTCPLGGLARLHQWLWKPIVNPDKPVKAVHLFSGWTRSTTRAYRIMQWEIPTSYRAMPHTNPEPAYWSLFTDKPWSTSSISFTGNHNPQDPTHNNKFSSSNYIDL